MRNALFAGSAPALSGGWARALADGPPDVAYPFGKRPVAESIEDAVKFSLDATKDAASDDSTEVVLTANEVVELKSRAPKVGRTWYGFLRSGDRRVEPVLGRSRR